jgi:hypothetical protein
MSDATLGDVYGAVFDAVEALGPAPSGSGSFALVKEFAGEITQELIEQVVVRKYPAALVALASEDSASASVDTTTGEMQTVARIQFVVYLAGLSLRGVRRSQETEAAGTKGLFALASEVIGALNGLIVDGLWGTGRVHYAGLRPQLLKPGALYVYALRFVADRVTEQFGLDAQPEATLDAFGSLDGDVDLVETDPTTEPAANPIAKTGGTMT